MKPKPKRYIDFFKESSGTFSGIFGDKFVFQVFDNNGNPLSKKQTIICSSKEFKEWKLEDYLKQNNYFLVKIEETIIRIGILKIPQISYKIIVSKFPELKPKDVPF